MKNPVYVKIVEDIRNKVNNGDLEPGDDIPSETTLCKEYDTSRMTVRKGLAILANEGYIYSIPGKGYYVKKPEYNKYTVYYDEMNNLINNVDNTRLIAVDIIKPHEELINRLQISKNKKIIKIRRVFYTDGEPMAYDIKYLIYQKGMPIIETEIKEATFPEMISKNTSLFAMKKELVIYATTPEESTKKLLNIYDKLALLVVEQKLYDSKDKPMGLGITYFRGDYIKIQGVSQ
ncbi:GntR family transcriptional regulator [Geosporobacter ferrireducens]|uniref:GntR family transcriptional regulator n=1 Tax=Geosporobacter ferrireducens TaxID=1424294 RepID=A0A1D8GJB9_9FIRM|nr:GntR family transcriptional regulator [Geosporobacter ferrireducens]AOT71006.1 GntR family transcriptional regulator [Geosporobacter ferrireducens]MTI53724.1 GntR family transcriptional regulator [Geosporobacter ferrireducens]